jgi:hypothetical protein
MECLPFLASNNYRNFWLRKGLGSFIRSSPHEDILDILSDFPKELEEIAFGRPLMNAPENSRKSQQRN